MFSQMEQHNGGIQGYFSYVSILSPSVRQIQDEEPKDKIPQSVNKVIGRHRLKMVRSLILVPPGCQACCDPEEVTRCSPELS